MNDCFSLRRFGKYLTYDLSSAWNNYGLSLIVSCCTPVMFYVVFQIIHIALGKGWGDYSIGFQLGAYMTSYLIVSMFAPAKLYGRITEKRYGTDWLMRPASIFEKTLSMVIVTCVAIPAAGCAVLFSSDALLSLLAPGYGHFLFGPDNMSVISEAFDIIGFGFTPMVFFAGFGCSILFFALGALFFKKSKVAKTILASFALSIIFSAVFASIFGTMTISGEELAEFFSSNGPEVAQHKINFWLNTYYFIFFVLVYLGIYFRIKTIKH